MSTYCTKDQRIATWLAYNGVPFLMDTDGSPVVIEDIYDPKNSKYLYFTKLSTCRKLATRFNAYDAPVDAHEFCDILYRQIKPLFL